MRPPICRSCEVVLLLLCYLLHSYNTTFTCYCSDITLPLHCYCSVISKPTRPIRWYCSSDGAINLPARENTGDDSAKCDTVVQARAECYLDVCMLMWLFWLAGVLYSCSWSINIMLFNLFWFAFIKQIAMGVSRPSQNKMHELLQQRDRL